MVSLEWTDVSEVRTASIIRAMNKPSAEVLFESLFSLTEISNIAAVRHFEVMLGQTLNCFV
jgi:hypothetical protein